MSVTIKNVAKAANVSVATVSRVLNNKANVSKETAEAVNKAIKSLEYSPNFLGRDLRKCETKRMLAVVSSMKYGFYSDVIMGMEQAAFARGYDVLVASTNSDPDKEMHILSMLFSRAVDAAIMLDSKLSGKVISELAENYNIALCLERIPDCNALTVSIDNVKAARDAISYLIGKGRRKIGLITTKTRAQSSVDREIGYKEALTAHGIKVDDDYIYYGTYDYESGIAGCESLLNLPKPPDAVFSISDIVSFGAMHAAAGRGLKIGSDIMFFGFDNISSANIFSPHLSTVEQPCVLQGRVVIEKLIENIKAPVKDRGLYIIPHSLILRKSTGD